MTFAKGLLQSRVCGSVGLFAMICGAGTLDMQITPPKLLVKKGTMNGQAEAR